MGEGPPSNTCFSPHRIYRSFSTKIIPCCLAFFCPFWKGTTFFFEDLMLCSLHCGLPMCHWNHFFETLKSRNYNRELPQPFLPFLKESEKRNVTGILSIEAISFDMSKVSKIFHQDPSKIQQTSFLVIQKFELPPQKNIYILNFTSSPQGSTRCLFIVHPGLALRSKRP